jgi:hypothetical protein
MNINDFVRLQITPVHGVIMKYAPLVKDNYPEKFEQTILNLISSDDAKHAEYALEFMSDTVDSLAVDNIENRFYEKIEEGISYSNSFNTDKLTSYVSLSAGVIGVFVGFLSNEPVLADTSMVYTFLSAQLNQLNPFPLVFRKDNQIISNRSELEKFSQIPNSFLNHQRYLSDVMNRLQTITNTCIENPEKIDSETFDECRLYAIGKGRFPISLETERRDYPVR